VERAAVLAIFFLIFAIGLNLQAGTFTLPSLEDLRGDVIRIETNSIYQQGVDLPELDKPSGKYPKESLYVGMMAIDDIRYTKNEIPTLEGSTLYGGYGVDVYTPGEPTSTLYVFAVDTYGNASEVVVREFRFVPGPVTGLELTPQPQGMVAATWDDSQDSDFDHYNVYINDNEEPNSTDYPAYTISGLSPGEQTIKVTVVDDLGGESLEEVRTLFLPEIQVSENGGVHGAGMEFSFDHSGDGVVDYQDAGLLLDKMYVSADVLNEVIIRWEVEQ
jgi:hypothetical protein